MVIAETEVQIVKKFQCHKCPQTFKNQDSFTDHILFHHSRIDCNICEKYFVGGSAFRKHFSDAHLQNFVLQQNNDLVSFLSNLDKFINYNVLFLLFQISLQIKMGNKMETPLHKAAESGDIQAVRDLIISGEKIDDRNRAGETPLHYAARFGNVEVLKLLIENAAKIDEVAENGSTPLHIAIKNRQFEI